MYFGVTLIHVCPPLKQVPFSYEEAGEEKQALVKLRVCYECGEKLNYKREKHHPKAKRREGREREEEGEAGREEETERRGRNGDGGRGGSAGKRKRRDEEGGGGNWDKDDEQEFEWFLDRVGVLP